MQYVCLGYNAFYKRTKRKKNKHKSDDDVEENPKLVQVKYMQQQKHTKLLIFHLFLALAVSNPTKDFLAESEQKMENISSWDEIDEEWNGWVNWTNIEKKNWNEQKM